MKYRYIIQFFGLSNKWVDVDEFRCEALAWAEAADMAALSMYEWRVIRREHIETEILHLEGGLK